MLFTAKFVIGDSASNRSADSTNVLTVDQKVAGPCDASSRLGIDSRRWLEHLRLPGRVLRAA